MGKFLRQNTATNILLGPLVAVSDGYTYLVTTITVDAGAILFNKGNTVSAFGAMAPAAVSCPTPGWLTVPVPASDLNILGNTRFILGNVTGNLPVWANYTVLSQNVYDSLISPGTDFLQVDVQQITGAAPSSAAIGSVANLTTGVAVSSIAAGVGVNVSSMGVGVNVLTVSGAAVSDAMGGYFTGYFATKIAVQVVTAVNAVVATGVLVATTVNANVLLVTGSPVSDAHIGSVANLATGVNVSSIAAGIGVNVSSIAAGVGVNVSSMGVGVNVTAIGGAAPTDTVFNANLVQCTGAAPSDAMPLYIWSRVLATPPGQTIEAGDYMKIIGAAVAGRCSGATSNPGLIVFYGPSGDAKVSGSFASGNRTGATWVT